VAYDNLFSNRALFKKLRHFALAALLAVTITAPAAAQVDCGYKPFGDPAKLRAYAKCKEADAAFYTDALPKSIRLDEAKDARREANKIEEERARAKKPGAKIGMTAPQVINETDWGPPEHINSTTTGGGLHKQWVYPGSQYLYFENSQLVSIQTRR
jgi:hypothetical protein